MDAFKVGVRVDIIGKNLKGTIAYIGSTQFASGKWIGVVLDTPKGKNNGTVQGKQYFSCEDNHGIFVRQHHITVSAVQDEPKTMQLSQSEAVKLQSPNVRGSRLKTPGGHRPMSRESSSEARESPEPPKPAPVQTPVQEEPVNVMQSISLHAGGISMVEYETAKAQAKDWKDKFETIRLKRQEDRSKMQEFEKLRIQVQQLNEWKTRASETQQDLMKQLRDAKKEAKEAVESKERYMEDMSDVQETIEMATLDKEMAEEKVETLQQEVELLKEKNEELQTDLEIIKAEIEDEGADGAASTYQVKQLEEQNARLKEALVRLRDLSTAEKAEHQTLEKEMEKKNKLFEELSQKKKNVEEELAALEETMDELKEQVDASSMAEEMVEKLTDQNLKLEEKVVDLEEQVHDLETMNDMNEELQENARETEMELREELDMANSRTKEATRKLDATTDIIGDYQDTIQKFRKMVAELQEANDNLRSATQSAESTPEKMQAPQVNYQIKMVETKASARSLDLELRKMEAKLANDHARFMSMFMPAMYNKMGGDRDCVQALLLVERIQVKSNIVAKHVQDRFDVSVAIEGEQELRGLRGEQVSFANELINQLNTMSVLMKKYQLKLNTCSVEVFQKVGTLYSEMSPNERAIDYLSEQLRKDTLDETTNTSNLVKAETFFKHLYSVHLSKIELDCWHEMDHYIIVMHDRLRAILFNCKRIKAFLKSGHETSDIAILLKDVDTAATDLLQFCKKLRRRMPQEPTNSQLTLKFDEKIFQTLARNDDNLSKLNKSFLLLVNKCSSSVDSNKLSHLDVQENLEREANVKYGSDNIYNAIRMSLGDTMASFNALVTSMQEGEFDSNETIKKIIPPVEKRADEMKSSITTSESLAYKMEEKESAILELKKIIKMKTDDIGESKLRIGMLERKLEIAGRESEEIKSVLQQKIDTLNDEAKKKEKEYDETLDALQTDIDTLEYDKAELKKRLVAQSKRSAMDLTSPMTGKTASATIASVLAGSVAATGSGTQVVVKDSPMLKQQIAALQCALKNRQMENCNLMGRQLLKRMQNLSPLQSQTNKKQSSHTELKIALNKLQDQIRSHVASPKVLDISKRRAGTRPVASNSPTEKLVQQKQLILSMQNKVIQLKQDVFKALSTHEVGGQIKADFNSFPTKEFAQSVNPPPAVAVGSITVPRGSDYRKLLPYRDVVLLHDELLRIHNKLLQPVH